MLECIIRSRTVQIAFLVATLLVIVMAGRAQAVTVGMTVVPPTPGTLFPGSSIYLSVGMSGLTAGSFPSVTAFDLDISFDPTKLSFLSASFLPVTGFAESSCPPVPFNPLCEAIVSITSTSNRVTLAATSLLAPAVIDATQPAAAAIALVRFLAISEGSSSVFFSGLDVAGTGPVGEVALAVTASAPLSFLVTIPEPGTGSLLSLGLVAMAWIRRRRASLPHFESRR